MRFAFLFFCAAALSQTPPTRHIRLEDLPQSLRHLDLDAIERDSQRRLREGELDHLVFYALQSTKFTSLPPIEPALSAKDANGLPDPPANAAQRLRAFYENAPTDPRHKYFRSLVQSESEIYDAYRRSMSFLFEKEWGSRPKQGAAKREHIAALYQTRAHSSDTQPEANYALHNGLVALKQLAPKTQIRRVLVVGPGADIAPRAHLNDKHPPQSYQPYLLADSLLQLGLSVPTDLTIDCADLNPRVVELIHQFADSPRLLHIPPAQGDSDWQAYSQRLGTAIGGKRLSSIQVSRRIAHAVRAFPMNILTERPDPPAAYDLAVVTNVLLYFNPDELGLALANISSALASGGHLLHNDLRPETERWTRRLSLPPIHARMVRLNARPERDLYDSVVIHRKR